MKKEGAIILGIGGDNSNSAVGTFFEGAMTSGYPSDATEDAVQADVVTAGYGSSTMISYRGNNAPPVFPYRVSYNSSKGDVIVGYTVHGAGRVTVDIFDQSGRRIAAIVNGVAAPGRREAVWDAQRVPSGVYVCRIALDGRDTWAGKIVVGK
jgi:hypothetical protein